MSGEICTHVLFQSGYFFYVKNNNLFSAFVKWTTEHLKRKKHAKLFFFWDHLDFFLSFVLVQMKKIPEEKKKHIKLYQTSIDQRDSWFNYTVEESQGGGLLSEE